MFSLSPAVVTREIDLSAVIGAAPSSFGAFAGKFHWGPVNQPMLISGEDNLTSVFGYPDSNNATDFFTIASFFAYTSGAYVTRVGNEAMTNATLESSTQIAVLNSNHFNEQRANLGTVSLLARYPGQVGNTLGVSICSTADQFRLVIKSELDDVESADLKIAFSEPVLDEEGAPIMVPGGPEDEDEQVPLTKSIKSKTLPIETGSATGLLEVGDYLVIDNTKYVIQGVDSTSITLDRIYVGNKNPAEVYRYWKFHEEFGTAPGTNEFHVVVFDNSGYFRTAGAVLESFSRLSTKVDAKDDQNNSAYWENVINASSSYLYAGKKTPDASGKKSATTTALTGGNNAENTIGIDEYILAYELYQNGELYNTPILIGGNAITSNTAEGAVLANYLVHSLAEVRKDTLAFISPPLEAVLNNRGREAMSTVEARKLVGSSSYATMDGNWKYMYDKYNDTFRWVPCNGDHAGVYALNDRERDPWVSAAGTSKGRIKNVVKFAYNPDKTSRDVLYSNDVNPMFTMAIVGPVLFGDKTLLGKNTALSRNNVRRLLIVLEKTIAAAAVDLLFEFNDEFTQRRFKSMVEPFLKDAQGRRGLTDFKVICDHTVNTPQVVQNNSFVGQIYIKPNYTISDIRLDFVVVNASASFEEVIGSY